MENVPLIKIYIKLVKHLGILIPKTQFFMMLFLIQDIIKYRINM